MVADTLLMLSLFSKIYLLGMWICGLCYFVRNVVLHRRLSRARDLKDSEFEGTVAVIRDHCAGLREAEHLTLGLGRALFAAQLSQLLFFFTPMIRATDAEPVYSIPYYLIVCQLCFLPMLLLLILDWGLSTHLRSVVRMHQAAGTAR